MILRFLMSVTAVLTLSVCAVAASHRSAKSVDCGALDEITLHSPQLQRDVTIDVWTPPGYGADTSARYPVVYMHDGQNLFDASTTWNHQSWEIDSVMGALLAQGAVRPAIVVGIYSNADTRVSDLMPERPYNMVASKGLLPALESMLPGGAKGDRYVDFIANDVKQLVDSLYSTLPGPDDTFVMGSSMGGLISLNALALRPDVYGAAACLSTHWTGSIEPNELFPTAMAAFMLENLPAAESHRLYMDTGDRTVDEAYLPYYQRFFDLAAQLGYTGDRLSTGFYPGAEHSERSWAARVAVPLTFLLGSKPEAKRR